MLPDIIIKDFPIKFVLACASHNKYPRKVADEEILESYEKYKNMADDSDACVSIKFKRGLEDLIDGENKNILSVGSEEVRAPLVAYSISSLLATGVPHIVVIGSSYVGKVVEGYKTMWDGVFDSRLDFVDEDSIPGRLSVTKTWMLGFKKISEVAKQKGEKVDYIHARAIDIILSQSDPYFLSPNSKADFAVYLNTAKVFHEEQGGRFTPRNYYHRVFQNLNDLENNINSIETKEGNRYEFSAKFIPIIMSIGDTLYSNREVGNSKKINLAFMIPRVLWKIKKAFKDPESIINMFRVGKGYVNHAYLQDELRRAGEGAGFLTEFRADHTDPYSLWDIDAYQDLNAYSHLIDNITQNGSTPQNLEEHFIGARILRGFVEEIMLNGGLAKEIPLYSKSAEQDYRVQRARHLGLELADLNSMNRLDLNGAIKNLTYQKIRSEVLIRKTPSYKI